MLCVRVTLVSLSCTGRLACRFAPAVACRSGQVLPAELGGSGEWRPVEASMRLLGSLTGSQERS